MGRVKRKCVKSPIRIIQSNSCQENGEPSNKQEKKLSNRSKCEDKVSVGKYGIKCPPVHHLEKAVVILEDIGNNFPFVAKRTVLSDKTNRSPMSSNNKKQEKCNDSKQQRKIPSFFERRISVQRSDKLSVRKQIPPNKSPQGVVSSDASVENHMKSLDSDKCIYGKVQRETLKNKNMPLAEKLAQYEFEVDENEPVVKKKKKKNVKRKKKPKLDEHYCCPSKVFQNILQAGVDEAAERIKEKPRNVFDAKDLKSNIDLSEGDTCREQADCEVQVDASSPFRSQTARRTLRSISENVSPDIRPDSQSKLRGVKSFTGLEVNPIENSTNCDESCGLKSHPNLDLDDSVDFCTSIEIDAKENKCNKSDQLKFPIRSQLSSPISKTIYTPIHNSVKDQRFSLRGVTSSTPFFQSTPLNRNCSTSTNASHCALEYSVNHSINLNKRCIIPRESGVNNRCNEVLAKNWSVENCFGFDDTEETAEFPPRTDISLNQRLISDSSTFDFTPSPSKRKPQHFNSYFKRKRELTTMELPDKSSTLCFRKDNTPCSPLVHTSDTRLNISKKEHSEKELGSSVVNSSSIESPFSNPLKQEKLDFNRIKTNSSTCETPKQADDESPLLFKDTDDKTPIHFKEPARRSYMRTVRRKLKPVGSEWIEFDSESEEEKESSHKTGEIRKKRTKLKKQEVKEANKWMKDFNRQCEEIEDFELCVEK